MGTPLIPKRRRSFLSTIFLIGAAILLSGCIEMQTAAFGLAPLYPELRTSGFRSEIVSVEVNSLTPELQWEPLPLVAVYEGGTLMGQITDVTYELMIWHSDNGLPGDLVYSRQGLREPIHKLETTLEPSMNYLWTVRAKFHVNGHPRVTIWGMSKLPLRRGYLKLPLAQNPNFFRFRTPS